jgi:hypothetical protein
VQAPDTQVWLVQATAVPHWPVGSHVCTPLPEHCAWPGPHTPVHAPETQVVLALQGLGVFCQVPLAVHVCGCWPLHWVEFGAQTPVHAPETHAWFVQAFPLFCQLPPALQL